MTAPIEAGPGHPTRIIDYESIRNGTANIFMLYTPLEGRREALVTDRRTTLDGRTKTPGVGHVAPDELAVDIIERSGATGIADERTNAFASIRERAHDMPTDEPASACNENHEGASKFFQ